MSLFRGKWLDDVASGTKWFACFFPQHIVRGPYVSTIKKIVYNCHHSSTIVHPSRYHKISLLQRSIHQSTRYSVYCLATGIWIGKEALQQVNGQSRTNWWLRRGGRFRGRWKTQSEPLQQRKTLKTTSQRILQPPPQSPISQTTYTSLKPHFSTLFFLDCFDKFQHKTHVKFSIFSSFWSWSPLGKSCFWESWVLLLLPCVVLLGFIPFFLINSFFLF